jgi:hypothetical protein
MNPTRATSRLQTTFIHIAGPAHVHSVAAEADASGVGPQGTSLSVMSSLHAVVAMRGSNCGPLEVQQQRVLLSLRWS